MIAHSVPITSFANMASPVPAVLTSAEACALSGVSEEPVIRLSSGIDSVDRLFGGDDTPGMALGGLTLLGGQEGMGKTRLYSLMLATMAFEGLRVGVAQMEMGSPQYKTFVQSVCRASGWNDTDIRRAMDQIVCTNSRDHEDHCRLIRDEGLSLFVWDSVQFLHNSKGEKRIEEIVFDVKDAIRMQCHGLMISHLNKQGKIKGNNHIAYLVDTTMLGLRETEIDKNAISVTTAKNRFGPTGVVSHFLHTTGGGMVMADPGWIRLRQEQIESQEDKGTSH